MTVQPPMQQAEDAKSRAEIEALTLHALSAETALKEAKGLLSRFVDEFGCTIERYHKIGPDFTFKDGTQVFDVGVVLDRADLIEEARALTLTPPSTDREAVAWLVTSKQGKEAFVRLSAKERARLVANGCKLEPLALAALPAAPDQGTTIQPSVSAAALKAEISRLLDWNGPIMSAWDAARADLLNGDEGSGPRDIMEAAFDAFHELPERLSSQADRMGEGS